MARATANRLGREQSPYLLQHQWNPVDWYPWGPEAFERARREDRPIFLSVGYSSCHWCHVMERESFESETIAKLLNDSFVSIKVDREERPDVDEVYMRAVQILTGSGGWPMSVFLTPDQKPFWGGTYFPPEDRGGRPGFATVVMALADAYRTRRDEVLDSADRLATAIRQTGAGARFVPTRPLDRAIFEAALDDLVHSYDRHNGGFGGAPKVPPHGSLALLLHATAAAPREDLEHLVRGTLDAMALGGIRDHVGGGFHRYATDAVWLVPHFEKMLYDNAQLVSAYAQAFARWNVPEYRRAAEETLEWVLREMTDAEGGFYSALDADSEGGEGAYYLWSLAEVVEALGVEEGALFARLYGMKEGGNFVDMITGEEPGNIPHLKHSWAELARAEGLTEDALRPRMDRTRATLLSIRSKRVPPGLDDKVVTSWNGLMIGAFSRAGQIFARPDFTQAALRASRFALSHLRRDGRLLRSWRQGEARIAGYLEDYAFLAWGLLELHEVTGDRAWLDEARSLVEEMIERFWDKDQGGFYHVAHDHESLIARPKDCFDSAIPSVNGMAARVLVWLWLVTGDGRYEARAAEMFRFFAGVLEHAPRAAESLLLAYMIWREAKPEETGAGASAGTVVSSAAIAAPAGVAVASATTGAGATMPGPLARAQRGPVIATATVDKRRIAPGEMAELALALEIDPGWHIQSAKPTRSALVATSVELGVAEGLAPGEMHFPDGSLAPIGGEKLSVYQGKVVVKVPITAARDCPPGRAPLIARIRFQACDDTRCLAPERVELEFAIEVG